MLFHSVSDSRRSPLYTILYPMFGSHMITQNRSVSEIHPTPRPSMELRVNDKLIFPILSRQGRLYQGHWATRLLHVGGGRGLR